MPRKITDNPDDQEFQVIGIATTMRGFRLAYYLNKLVYLDLKKGEDILFTSSDGQQSGFSYYAWEESGSQHGFYLIANRTGDGILVPDHRQADFFLFISGSLPDESLTRIMNSIRNIPHVLTAYRINLKTSKSMRQFLPELELYNLNVRRSGKKKPLS